MINITALNVNDAYHGMMQHALTFGKRQDSRNGPVISLQDPVCLTTQVPQHRVLQDNVRDANPFFHLFEAFWMLAGRNDVEFVSRYVPRMTDYSDDGRTLHGAYGFRWREHFERDQLVEVAKQLSANPDDRRVVINMWDPYIDPQYTGKDVPCNISLLPRIVSKMGVPFLDMTVINRSNDIYWGMTGANAVHMSIFQEALAAMIKVDVGGGVAAQAYCGTMHQFSTNAHLYTELYPKEYATTDEDRSRAYYQGMTIELMFTDREQLLFECEVWCDDPDNDKGYIFVNPCFHKLLIPMHWSWRAFKDKEYEKALACLEPVMWQDWRDAAREWIERRMPKEEG